MKPDIYFYSNVKDKPLFLCELLQKILEQSASRIAILTRHDAVEQTVLSDRLWGAISNSFLPNQTVNDSSNNKGEWATPIVITSSLDYLASSAPTVLVNLNLQVIEIPPSVTKMILIVDAESSNTLENGRRCYKHYQQNLYPLKHFDMCQWKPSTTSMML